MLEKEMIAIDLGATNIKIMMGNKVGVKHFEIIQTPEGAIKDDRIENTDEIKKILHDYLNKNHIKTKKVSFVVNGQDIVARHIEVPVVDDKGIMTSLNWEMNQYLPNGVDEYIIDYKIIEKIETIEKKTLKLFVVAVPKGKINKIVELAKKLNLDLDSIDVSTNCISRVFMNIPIKQNINENIAIIDIGNSSTNIVILEKGKLFIEREIPFGVNNIVKEIVKKENMEYSSAFEYLEKKINLTGGEYASELERRILSLFDNVFSSLEKIVSFFTIGKSKSNLDEIYLIGEGCFIKGLSEYVSAYYKCPVNILSNVENVGVKFGVPKNCDVKLYVGALGLLLRKE